MVNETPNPNCFMGFLIDPNIKNPRAFSNIRVRAFEARDIRTNTVHAPDSIGRTTRSTKVPGE